MTEYKPKTLAQKKPVYQNDSFASWMEKTLVTTIELGDLNNLCPLLFNVLKDAAQEHAEKTPVTNNDLWPEKFNVVDALNETVKETRRVLIRAIAMS